MQEKNSLKFENNKDYVLDLIDKDNEDLIGEKIKSRLKLKTFENLRYLLLNKN